MAKKPHGTESKTVRITLSRQSVDLLSQLAMRGIYGRNPAEVASRLVDRALQDLVGPPKLKLIGDPSES
jgi:hypothetical protein